MNSTRQLIDSGFCTSLSARLLIARPMLTLAQDACEQLEFHRLGRRHLIGRFDGGEISPDGRGLLWREVDQPHGLLDRLAHCFTDYRHTRNQELTFSLIR